MGRSETTLSEVWCPELFTTHTLVSSWTVGLL